MGVRMSAGGLRASRKTAQGVLRAEGLTKHYGPVVGLEGLALEVPAGEVLGYLGPNGAARPPRSGCCSA